MTFKQVLVVFSVAFLFLTMMKVRVGAIAQFCAEPCGTCGNNCFVDNSPHFCAWVCNNPVYSPDNCPGNLEMNCNGQRYTSCGPGVICCSYCGPTPGGGTPAPTPIGCVPAPPSAPSGLNNPVDQYHSPTTTVALDWKGTSVWNACGYKAFRVCVGTNLAKVTAVNLAQVNWTTQCNTLATTVDYPAKTAGLTLPVNVSAY